MANVKSDDLIVIFPGIKVSLPSAAFKAAQRKFSNTLLEEGALQTSCAEALPAIRKSDCVPFDFLGKNFWPVEKFKARHKDGLPTKPAGIMFVKITVLGSFALQESLVKDPLLIVAGRPETVKTNPEKVVLFLKKAREEVSNAKLEEMVGEVKKLARDIASVQGILLYKKHLPKTSQGKGDAFFDYAMEIFANGGGSVEIGQVLERLCKGCPDEVTVNYGAFRDFTYNPES